MSDYYPLEDEYVDLDFLLKRLKANGVFPHLSQAEILHLFWWHEWNGYIKLFTWDLDNTYISSFPLLPERIDNFLDGQVFLSILGFDKCEDIEVIASLEGQPDHYYLWGSVYRSSHNKIPDEGLGFNSLPIDYVCISVADAKAIEKGKFKETEKKQKQIDAFNDYIENVNPNFSSDIIDYDQAWKVLQDKYGFSIFGLNKPEKDGVGQSARKFFSSLGVSVRRNRKNE